MFFFKGLYAILKIFGGEPILLAKEIFNSLKFSIKNVDTIFRDVDLSSFMLD